MFLSRPPAVLVAAVAAFTVSASPSSAADIGTATLSRSLCLTESPTAGPAASMSRSIYLTAGRYSWSSDLAGEGQTFASRYI
ncbi:hypothetical protein ACF1G0_28625 [Streptomyces sp. NPDC013953]|uniref:hypothetical protein n=1 Tax=Streptomyces sp. NPDC013953 TaxID=3364868 RepID=UPI0036F60355